MDKHERREAVPASTGIRQAPFALRDTTDGEPDDGWTLDGYGAVFNRFTVIDSWEGVFREQIAGGAMKRTFRETPPIIQFDHGRHPLIGSFPIAELKSVREDTDPELAPEGGAHIVGRIFQHLFFEPLREAIAARAIKGMSFRFSVVREKWATADGKTIRDDEQLLEELRKTWRGDVPEEELPIRTLQELKVPEMGPVVWPAYSDTSVGVRDQVINLGELFREENHDQRVALARKLWAMPKFSAAQNDTDSQRSTGDKPAGERQSESRDSQQATGEQPVGERQSPNQLSTKQVESFRKQLDLKLSQVRSELLKIETGRK